MSLQPHPTAELFPLMTGADFDALVADIREHGQQYAIVVHDGLILDGRNRYRACQRLGIEPFVEEWDQKGTPEAFVISMNLHRRHLNESQRAVIAKKLAQLPVGANQHRGSANLPTLPQEEAASLMNVSARSIRLAGVLLTKGTPEQIAAVNRGEASISAVVKQIQEAEATKSAAVDQASDDGDKTARAMQSEPESIGEIPQSSERTDAVVLGPQQPRGFSEATHTMGAIRRLANWCRGHTPAFVGGGVKDHDLAEDLEEINAVLPWLAEFSTILKERQK